jgi:hypothetical protein
MTDTISATLFVCPIEWRNTCASEPLVPFVAVDLQLSHACWGANSAIITINNTQVHYRIVRDNVTLRSNNISLCDLFTDIGVSEAFSADAGLSGNYVPLFLSIPQAATQILYSCTTFHSGKLLFLNAGIKHQSDVQPPLLADEGQELAERLDAALEFHRRSYLFLNNHNNFNFYKKYRPDDEIEYKYNLERTSNIWLLAVDLHRSIGRGDLAPFILHFANPITHWDFDNHMFEIYEPAVEQGYISFIPTASGKYILKRKIYTADALIRKEFRQREIDITTTFEDYLLAHFPGLAFRKLPPFRRVRYDVDFESLDTGNIYSVMFDRCAIMEFDCTPLLQCEVEYIQTRSCHQPIRVLDELEQVNLFVHAFLIRQAAQPIPTYYSKLTYLKDMLTSMQHNACSG